MLTSGQRRRFIAAGVAMLAWIALLALMAIQEMAQR
jgi:hypothetical protein